MLESCYSALGLEKEASVDEIKKAYRHLARQYHPDVNKEPDAKERFIKINEAYELLIKHSRNIQKGVFTPENDFYTDGADSSAYIEWLQNVQNKARERAARNAKLKFEKFKDSYIYKSAKTASLVFDILYLLCGLIIIVVPFFFASFKDLTTVQILTTILAIMGAEFFGGIFVFVIVKSRIEIMKGNQRFGM